LLVLNVLLVLGLKRVENINQQSNILHILNAEWLANRVYLDGELLFHWSILTSLKCPIINQVLTLVDQHLEHILNSFEFQSLVSVIPLIRGVMTLVSGVVLDSRLWDSVVVVTALIKGLLMDLTSLCRWVSTFETVVGSWAILCLTHGPEDWVTWWFPGDVELLLVDDFISVHDFLNNSFGLFFVHFPNLFQTVIIRFFKSFKFLLKLLKLLCENFELIWILLILPLETSKLNLVVAFYLTHNFIELTLTVF
jgi:hypothetical protein